MDELTTVSVTVPSGTVGELCAFVATLHASSEEAAVATGEDLGTKDAPKQRAAAGFGAATVRKNYLGGVSSYWRPFLEELATQPDEWVAWTQLCEAIDLEPNRASGMLGAAERRCKLLPPYEKAYEDGEHWFRMPKSVAEVITDLAGEQ